MQRSSLMTMTQWPPKAPRDPFFAVESVYALFNEQNSSSENLQTVFTLLQYEVGALQSYKHLWNQVSSRFVVDMPRKYKRTCGRQYSGTLAKTRHICTSLTDNTQNTFNEYHTPLLMGLRDIQAISFEKLSDITVNTA